MIKQWKNEARRMSKLTKRTISALLVDNTGGLSQGLEIVVTADADSADSGSNIMPAKQIDLME